MICYFFVDEDGTENVSNICPIRHPEHNFWIIIKPMIIANGNIQDLFNYIDFDSIVELPRNTIKSLFNVNLTFNDDPIIINVK